MKEVPESEEQISLEGAEPAGEQVPFLQIEGLELPGHQTPVTLRVERGPLLCLGKARALVSAALNSEPQSVVFRVDGVAVRELLQSGRLGYCPRRLPAASADTVFGALRASARLIGASTEDVRRALRVAGLSEARKRRLATLSPLEHRLLGVAHGICGEPPLLFLEDLLSDLDDAGARRVDSVLHRALDNKNFVLAGGIQNTSARSFWARAEAAIVGQKGELLGPFAASSVLPTSHFVTTRDSAHPLALVLEEAGIPVARCPNANSLFVLGPAEMVLTHAFGCGAKIVALTPTEHGLFLHPHARSGS